ncbi:MAG TPA: hypothetical protein H9902_06255 [Candidatus Stackebrandtia faecavium]|nr:hypothetical protein [Candidatus Stackebrandtia faecavium]
MKSLRGKRRMLIAAGASAAIAVSVGIGAPMAMADSAPEDVTTHEANAELLDPQCAVPPGHDVEVINIVHDIAQERGVTDKVMLSAFEAGWVESHMNNLDCGDADSIGVFQQRPSQGWCDPASLCMDVRHATNAYLDQAIPNDANNPGFTAGQLAQSVQRSAYPERYDEAEGKAHELIAEAQA